MSWQSVMARQWKALRQFSDRTPLRLKMITAVLALVTVALGAISIAGISFLRTYLFSQSDDYLASFEEQAHSWTQDCLLPSPVAQCPKLAGTPGLMVDWIPGRGKLEAVVLPISGFAIPSLRPVQAPGPDLSGVIGWMASHPGEAINVPAVSGGHHWRVVGTSFPVLAPSRNLIAGTIVVGVDVTNDFNTIGRLASIDLTVSAIVIVALALVGVAVVRASLQPLTDIERTAADIASGDLSQRVPDRDPRTEVGQLGRALNAMLTQVERAFHAQAESEAAARQSEERMRRFVADASHELRTPVTVIRGYAEYYRQRGGTTNGASPEGNGAAPSSNGAAPGPAEDGAMPAGHLSSGDVDRIMERVERESTRMGGLVEDMLLLARLDQQRPVELRPVDLLTLVGDAVQDSRMIAPSRPIELTVASATAFIVLGDEARLRQVLINLMSNALTHTPDATPVSVRLLAGDGPDPAVILEVADQGPGLTKEQASRVFERFYRADQARDRRTGGTGLGLAIVAALVAAHGGTVSLETAPDEGATFRIVLPLAPEAQAQQASP